MAFDEGAEKSFDKNFKFRDIKKEEWTKEVDRGRQVQTQVCRAMVSSRQCVKAVKWRGAKGIWRPNPCFHVDLSGLKPKCFAAQAGFG